MPRKPKVLICCLGAGLTGEKKLGTHGRARIEMTVDIYREDHAEADVAFSGTPQEIERYVSYWRANFGASSTDRLITDRSTYSTPNHPEGIDKALELQFGKDLTDYDYIHVVSSYSLHAWRSACFFKRYLRLKLLHDSPTRIFSSPPPTVLVAFKATPISGKRQLIEAAQCLIAFTAPILGRWTAAYVTHQRRKKQLPLHQNSGPSP